jgi:hypothetical protein
VVLWQAAFYKQNDISLRAAWSKLEGLLRPAGCVFDNPMFDDSAATLSCLLLGPPVASEDKGPIIMVGVHLAACSRKAGPTDHLLRVLIFLWRARRQAWYWGQSGCLLFVATEGPSSAAFRTAVLFVRTADAAWIQANQLSRFGKRALQLMARQRKVMHSRWLHCTVRS